MLATKGRYIEKIKPYLQKMGSEVVYKKIIKNYFYFSSSINVPENLMDLKKLQVSMCADFWFAVT